ncbi:MULTISPECIES: hypothetical protein [Bradyrhizobium]|uniref:hypothetical protein n=1 Tax=Bradyrhizobium TaxID=374 RepID=UPI00067D411B|nr:MULTISPECIES: hypothetical protein [Bradyrhizobium]PAY08643.1 hypothetical protein CK489_13260 [Bradyrhizobium sp. UFLA03-84]
MTIETEISDEMNHASDAFQDLTRRAIATQTEFSKRYLETYWHWQERMQAETTQLTDLYKKVFSTLSTADQIGIFQVWMKGATQRAARDLIYSIESAKAIAKVEPLA